jgi:hypothetical protein
LAFVVLKDCRNPFLVPVKRESTLFHCGFLRCLRRKAVNGLPLSS